MTDIALVLIAAGALAFLVRLLVGPSLADRIVALDGLLAAITAGILIGAAHIDSPVVVPTVLVVALVGFVGTSAIARYIEQRGNQ